MIELKVLTAEDLFPMVAIINKLGMEEIMSCMEDVDISEFKNEEDLERQLGIKVAMKMIQVMFSNFENIKVDLFELVSNLTDKSVEEIQKLPLDEFAEVLIAIFQKEEFKNFLQVVFKFIK